MDGMPADLATEYVTTLIDGRLCAVWNDGTVLPVVRGGADDGGGDGGGDEGGDGSGDGGADDGDGSGDDDATGKGGDADKVTMTQAELDRLVASEKAKAKKAAEAEAKQAAERAKMDEAERLKAEKADSDKAAAEATAKANARVIRSEAKLAAVASGVKADRVERFLKLVDLDGIEVDDDGEVDSKAVSKAVAAALKDVPEFKGDAGQGNGGASGGDMNSDGERGRAKSIEDAVSARLAG